MRSVPLQAAISATAYGSLARGEFELVVISCIVVLYHPNSVMSGKHKGVIKYYSGHTSVYNSSDTA